jgi:uncharacterized membrane protein
MTTKTTETTSITTTTNAPAGVQAAPVSPAKRAATKKASPGRKPAKAKQGAKKAERKGAAKKTAKPAASKKDAPASVPREFSKKAIVLDLLRRKNGATMAEIAKATDWQNHSIRGFISGTVAKRMGLAVESTKNEAGERTHKITE